MATSTHTAPELRERIGVMQFFLHCSCSDVAPTRCSRHSTVEPKEENYAESYENGCGAVVVLSVWLYACSNVAPSNCAMDGAVEPKVFRPASSFSHQGGCSVISIFRCSCSSVAPTTCSTD